MSRALSYAAAAAAHLTSSAITVSGTWSAASMPEVSASTMMPSANSSMP
eukprot:CAMPEP_0118945508 /NCGR_PEP_ID=MMETSP1169-20130426/42415_1 /TAXON_ID=36882 /ORGANISM="Pyramimonas obovata, Strain CCMP722" /LENGTH=48 /DNA_ID= /DNA_START= /DNA_END= /DNA_ORIENTATION=